MFSIKHYNNSWYLVGRSDHEGLEGSIEKWRIIVDFLKGCPGATLYDGACTTCSLCHEHGIYSDQPDEDRWDCKGCPVSAYTGLSDCKSTPYEDYNAAMTLGNARAELGFLEMLWWRAVAQQTTGEERKNAWHEFVYREALHLGRSECSK